jgi:hypothetical protein
MSDKGTMSKIIPLLLALTIGVAGGGCMRRDDSTGTTRRIVAEFFGVDYSQATAETTLGDLGCTKPQLDALLAHIESQFRTKIRAEDDPRLRGDDASWKNTRVVDLADMVRPEWNKPGTMP